VRATVRSATGGIASAVLVLVGTVMGAPAALAAVSPTAPVVINEVYGGGGNSGAAFNQDFVELFNPTDAPVSLAGWSLQYASSGGAFSASLRTALVGTVPAHGYYLVGQAFGAGTSLPALPTPDATGTVAMSGTGAKVALVGSTDVLACTGAACATDPTVVDLVGWGAAANAWAGTAPAPATTNATSVARSATHTNSADNAADFVAGAPTPQGSGVTEVPGNPGDPAEVPIAAVQGSAAASPLAGQAATTSGVVTATYPEGGFAGFVIQTPGTGGALDAGHVASDALFVYSPATVASVAIGDHVRVTGQVSEYSGLTELTVAAGGVTVLADPAAPVTPVTGAWPSTAAGREALESMLYAAQGPWTVTDTYSTNQYGEVGLAAGTTPLVQPTELGAPGSAPALAAAADAVARGVVLDDGATTNFLSAANSGLTPPYVSLTNPVRVGEAVTFTAPVVVDYRNNTWKLDPTTRLVAGGTLPVTIADDRTTAPEPVGGDLRLATFNVLNYFTTLGATTAGCTSYKDRTGDPVTVNSGCAPRGAWDPEDLARQQAKIVAAINALDADVVGLLEIENSLVVDGVPDEALGTLVDALNAAAGAGTWAYVPSSAQLPPVAQMDVITNAIIYRPSAVQRSGASLALGTLSADDQAFGNAREPVAQEFEPAGGGQPFLVVVNHLKSKGSAGPWPGDADTGNGQGASNESRVRQTTALRDWVATIAAPGEAVALVGDFNSYTHEDPLQVLYDAGYTDASSTLAPGQYSYSFDGLSGSLDHVLLNAPALARATGADIWEINAEESIALEYSRYNYHGTLFYDAGPYRSSDHDPVVVGLTAGQDNTGPVDLTFLNINDFHGRIDANTVKLAGTVEQQRAAATGPVAFLSAGDNFGASLFASATAQDQPTIDVLNALGLKASAVGNHEFDQGFADLTGRVIAGGSNATWDYLGANVYLKGTTTPALPEYALIDMAGVSVGVIGVVTQETPTLVSPAGVSTLDFGDPVAAVNRVAAQLSDGDPTNGEADVLVAEYHEGAGAGTPDGATLDQELAAGGTFARIVNDTSSQVDAIFTGHTHKRYAWAAPVPGDPTRTRPVVQTGSYGEFLGSVVLTYDRDSGEVVAHTEANIARTTTADADLVAAYPRVAQVKSIVDTALASAAVVGNQPVGSVTADITTAFSGGSYVGGVYVGGVRDDRASESTLGNLVADALLNTLGDPSRGGAQIGVVNPGGLRAELRYAPDGVITYAEANSVLPFVNNLWTTTLTGAQVKTMLEQQWQTNADGTVPSRPYLQLGLSSNVSYTFDPAAARGSHITSVTVNGVPLDPAGQYRIGTFSFLTSGGDNFRALAQGTAAADSGLIDRDAWIAYLRAHPGLTPSFARRAVAAGALPTSVQAGNQVSVPLSGLDLTSLGSPRNTTLSVLLDGAPIGTVDVVDGAAGAVATVPAATPAGTHVLTLVAAPSGTTVTLPLAVEAATPVSTTTLTAAPSSQVYGSSRVTFTATVTASVPVTGDVEFVSGGTVLGTAALTNGVATFRLPARTAAGTYDVVARFAGSTALVGSQSAPVRVVVAQVATHVSLVATRSQQSSRPLLPTLFLIGVSQDGGGLPAGTVELRDGDTVIARLGVVAGVAIGVLPRGSSVGVHTYTATFVPSDANHAPSTSRAVTVRITR